LASAFNIALWYVFQRHLENKKRIQRVLRFTEKKLANLYGADFVPDFPDLDSSGPPNATTVMHVAVIVLTGLFALRAVLTMCSCCKM